MRAALASQSVFSHTLTSVGISRLHWQQARICFKTLPVIPSLQCQALVQSHSRWTRPLNMEGPWDVLSLGAGFSNIKPQLASATWQVSPRTRRSPDVESSTSRTMWNRLGSIAACRSTCRNRHVPTRQPWLRWLFLIIVDVYGSTQYTWMPEVPFTSLLHEDIQPSRLATFLQHHLISAQHLLDMNYPKRCQKKCWNAGILSTSLVCHHSLCALFAKAIQPQALPGAQIHPLSARLEGSIPTMVRSVRGSWGKRNCCAFGLLHLACCNSYMLAFGISMN